MATNLGKVTRYQPHPRRRHDDRADASLIARRLFVIAIAFAIVIGFLNGTGILGGQW